MIKHPVDATLGFRVEESGRGDDGTRYYTVTFLRYDEQTDTWSERSAAPAQEYAYVMYRLLRASHEQAVGRQTK